MYRVCRRSESTASACRWLAGLALCWMASAHGQAAGPAGEGPAYRVDGDAIPVSLTGVPGDAARGRAIVASRQQGLCLLCHTGPIPEERFQGNLAPDLAGAGSRWSEGQLRLRIVDARHFNAATIMPSYYRTQGLVRVASIWQGKTILSAQQVEDVVAYLGTLDDRSSSKEGGAR